MRLSVFVSAVLLLCLVQSAVCSLSCGSSSCHLEQDLVAEGHSVSALASSLAASHSFLAQQNRLLSENFFRECSGNSFFLDYDDSTGLANFSTGITATADDLACGGAFSRFFYADNSRELTEDGLLRMSRPKTYLLLFSFPLLHSGFCASGTPENTAITLSINASYALQLGATGRSDSDVFFFVYDGRGRAAILKSYDDKNHINIGYGLGFLTGSVDTHPFKMPAYASGATDGVYGTYGVRLCRNCSLPFFELSHLSFDLTINPTAEGTYALTIHNIFSPAFEGETFEASTYTLHDAAGPGPEHGLFFGLALDGWEEQIDFNSIELQMKGHCPFPTVG